MAQAKGDTSRAAKIKEGAQDALQEGLSRIHVLPFGANLDSARWLKVVTVPDSEPRIFVVSFAPKGEATEGLANQPAEENWPTRWQLDNGQMVITAGKFSCRFSSSKGRNGEYVGKEYVQEEGSEPQEVAAVSLYRLG